MSKFFIVFLTLLLLGLGVYTVYALAPQLLPKTEQLTNLVSKINPLKGQTTSPTPTPQPPAATAPTPTPIMEPLFTNSLTITNYLEKYLGLKGFDGKIYCSYKTLETYEGKPTKIYVLSLCQEYYDSQGKKLPGSGMITPVVLSLNWENENFDIKSHITPTPGSGYATSVRAMFPSSISEYLLSDKYLSDVSALQQKVESAVY